SPSLDSHEFSDGNLKPPRDILCEYFPNDATFDVGQAEVAARVAVGQSFVVESEQVQQRRMQVMDMHLVDCGVIAVIIRLAVRKAGLHAAPGEPPGEGVRIVVAPIATL